ncbi:MAG: helix-turn-helix domain-containing protein [Desulfosarcinaceae bacterium]|jgi:excisionase family DNA binding protein
MLTTSQVAKICKVDRTTVGYWIRTAKIRAKRVGKKYLIAANDLRLYLESQGQQIPKELFQGSRQESIFPDIQPCWRLIQTEARGSSCIKCPVYKRGIEPCFTYQAGGTTCSSERCLDCEFYRNSFFPRIKFIHQMRMPAAVYKDLFIWGANSAFESLCELKEGQAIGYGIEQLVHPDSMEMVISFAKRRSLGHRQVPKHYEANFKTKEKGRINVFLSIVPLIEPQGTFLMIVEPLKSQNQPTLPE